LHQTDGWTDGRQQYSIIRPYFSMLAYNKK
jgi:hypothetical protein